MRRWLLAVFVLLPVSAFAAGGSCPSGANYVNPASSTTTGVTLSSLGISSCFYASASGSDSHTGTAESSPWLHLPGMSGCSNTCSSTTPTAGEGFILEGGSVYYYSGSGTPVASPWSISWSGTSSAPIYFGVDPTWYSGASWARPVITGNNPTTTNTTVSSCTYGDDGDTFISQAGGSYTIVDDIEITGACYASSGFTLFYTGSATNVSWTRNYAHGWTRAAACSGSGCGNGPAAFMTDNGPNVGFGDIWAFDVVDGSDTAGNIVSGILWNCYDVHGSVIRYVANQLCDTHTFHDNWLNTTTEPTFSGDHGNTMEENSSWVGAASGGGGVGANTYYNNLTSYAGTAVDWWLNPQSGYTCAQGGCDYVFNNVFYQINSPGNTFNIGENNGAQGYIYFYNNTFENPNNDVILTCGVSGYAAPFTAANDHYITDNSTAYAATCSGQGTYVTELLMTHATATADGYTASETYAYSPTSSSSPTVHAGTNETTFCTNIGSQGGPSAAVTACENDTTYSCNYNSTTHSVSCPDRTVNSRPSSGAWDQGAYEYVAAGPGFTCSPSTVPANHSGNIALTCTGTGTSWTSSTVFTVGSPATLVSYSNTNSTTETVTITTSSSTGSSTITDTTDSLTTSITVATETFTISPSSGAPGSSGCTSACQGTITFTGTNSVWSVSALTLSVSGSGCTGDSIGSPTITSNTAATATLTWGSSACTETITDTSTGATASFTVATSTLPTVTTGTVGSITGATATVSSNSYTCTGTCAAVTAEGTCYATTNNPTTPCTSDGTTSPWNSSLSSLSAHALYYYRAYATNSVGTAYGSTSSFTTPVISYVNGAGGSSQTFSYTAHAANDAVLFSFYCHSSSGIPTSATLTASGWTFTQLGTLVNNGTGAGTLFGAIAPNTTAASFTVAFGSDTCNDFFSYLVGEFSGNNTTGGTTTFPASGVSGAASGGCDQSAAAVTASTNQAVWGTCVDSATGATSPWILGANDGNENYSEYQVYGVSGSQTPAWQGTTGAYVALQALIAPLVTPIAQWHTGSGTVSNGWYWGGPGPPLYRYSSTSQAVYQLPSTIPTFNTTSPLYGAGRSATFQWAGNTITETRLTDLNNNCNPNAATLYSGGQVSNGGSGDENHFNALSPPTLVVLGAFGGWNCPYSVSVSGNTMSLSRIDNSFYFPSTINSVIPSYSTSTPNVMYAMGAPTNTAFESYNFTGYCSTCTAPTPSEVYDFASSSNCLGSGYSETWTDHISNSKYPPDTYFAEGFSNAGAQDTGFDVVVYKVGSGCSHLNTSTGAVTGDWGSTGTISIGDRFTIHNVLMAKAGPYVVIQWETCNTTCSAASGTPYVWIPGTLSIEPLCTTGNKCGGHFTEGSLGYVNISQSTSFQEEYRAMAGAPNAATDLKPTLSCSTDAWAAHLGWSNNDPADFIPYMESTTSNKTGLSGSTFTCPYSNEIDLVSPLGVSNSQGGLVYREAPTLNSNLQTAQFSCEYAIASSSPDGKWTIWESDDNGNFGSTSGGSTCSTTTCRCEVLAVENQ